MFYTSIPWLYSYHQLFSYFSCQTESPEFIKKINIKRLNKTQTSDINLEIACLSARKDFKHKTEISITSKENILMMTNIIFTFQTILFLIFLIFSLHHITFWRLTCKTLPLKIDMIYLSSIWHALKICIVKVWPIKLLLEVNSSINKLCKTSNNITGFTVCVRFTQVKNYDIIWIWWCI